MNGSASRPSSGFAVAVEIAGPGDLPVGRRGRQGVGAENLPVVDIPGPHQAAIAAPKDVVLAVAVEIAGAVWLTVTETWRTITGYGASAEWRGQMQPQLRHVYEL